MRESKSRKGDMEQKTEREVETTKLYLYGEEKTIQWKSSLDKSEVQNMNISNTELNKTADDVSKLWESMTD